MIGDEVMLLVPVSVQGHDFEFLIDTRSAYTALSEDLVILVGLTTDRQRTAAIAPVQGAMMRVPLILLAEMRVGGFRTAN